MKVTVVPAQITTIEDRVAGNLSFSQLLLLAAPVFGGSALYIILPPTMHSAPYKLTVIAVLLFLCGLLAIRIKGKILLLWFIVLIRYNLRPRYYIFDKNDLAAREQYTTTSTNEEAKEDHIKQPKPSRLPALSVAATARIQALMENPAAHLTFETKRKGGLYVRITEVKEQN